MGHSPVIVWWPTALIVLGWRKWRKDHICNQKIVDCLRIMSRCAQGRLIGTFEIDMQIIVEIGYDIKMNRMSDTGLNIVVMTMVFVMIDSVTVMLFLLNVQSLQRVVRHPRPNRGQYENQDQKCSESVFHQIEWY